MSNSVEEAVALRRSKVTELFSFQDLLFSFLTPQQDPDHYC